MLVLANTLLLSFTLVLSLDVPAEVKADETWWILAAVS